MGSSIPTARAALYAALSASEALEDVQVTYGPPEVHTEDDEVVAILGVVNVDTGDAAIGGSKQEERYAIKGRIKVHDPTCGGTPTELQTLDARSWALYDAVRDEVQSDRTLGGALTLYATLSTAGEQDTEESPVPALDENDQPYGWVAFIDWRITCQTRIT